MNGKEAKKIRQLYRKNVGRQAREMGRTIGNAMKPKPWWIPMWLWIKMLSCFIHVNKTGVKK
jgi:hypothetical protein